MAAGDGLTLYSNLAPAVQAYYDKRFLIRAKDELVGYQFAQKRSLPGGSGKTVYFTRYLPLNKVTSALTESLDGGLDRDTRQKLQTEEVSATAALWGDYVEISKLASVTALDRDVSQKVDILGQQAGESVDAYIAKTMGQGLLRRRADADGTYQVEGTADSGSTTTLVDDALTQIDDFWNGGFITITAGTNYGMTRQVTDFVASTDTVSFAAFPKAIDTTSKYRLVVGTGIATGDVMTTANIRLALRDLWRNKAMKAEGGYYIGILDPDTTYDFMGDTTWVGAATYKDSVDSLYKGEVGKWMGIRFVMGHNVLRESVSGTAGETAAVHVAAILGREAYGVVELEGQQQKIYIRTPEQLAQPIPMYSTCGWQVGFEAKALNSCFGVGLMCGATV